LFAIGQLDANRWTGDVIGLVKRAAGEQVVGEMAMFQQLLTESIELKSICFFA
jgi:hypothetical protein